MARIKDILLENGTLTDATDGFDSVLGTPTRDTSSQIKGVGSMRCQAVGDEGQEDFTAVASVYVSAYVKYTTLPASTQTRVIFIDNTGTTLCRIYITSAGAIQLRDGAATIIGSATANGTIAVGNLYRLGIRYTAGSGANAIIEGYWAANDDVFGAPFASTTTDTGTLQGNRVEIGSIGGIICDVFVDDIRIDDAAMPGPSISVGAQAGAHIVTSVYR